MPELSIVFTIYSFKISKFRANSASVALISLCQNRDTHYCACSNQIESFRRRYFGLAGTEINNIVVLSLFGFLGYGGTWYKCHKHTFESRSRILPEDLEISP